MLPSDKPHSKDRSDGLPQPVVPAEAYDEEYYRSGCMGAQEWQGSEGERVSGMYFGYVERAGLREGETVLDIGAGRGEFLAVAVRKGARRAVGIEYAAASLPLARKTIEQQGVGGRALAIHADARALPVGDETVDLVTLLDVVEHLAPAELDRTLIEAFRVLRPGGRVLIHTFPNRNIFEVTYWLQRALRPSRRRSWPGNPRTDYEQRMHVNEQTLGSLRRGLRRAGFDAVKVELGGWVYTDFVPEPRPRRLYRLLARTPGLARFGRADLWAVAHR